MQRTLCLLVLIASAGCDEAAPPLDGSPAEVDAGASDGGGADAGPAGATPGCGTDPGLATEEWVARTLDVAGTSRDWFVYLPPGYDPARAYPVVYQFHGCSSSPERENNNVPVQRESGGDAIHVRGRAVDNCWDAAADGPDVAFFDALVAEVESSFCADPARRFGTGYSSGSFMVHRLACLRGDVLRGVASIAGGQFGNNCEGATAALLIHDRNDSTVGIEASENTRDAHAERNGCGATRAASTPTGCEAYDGCDAGLPVLWCETSGMDHSRQDGFAAPAFWEFLSSL